MDHHLFIVSPRVYLLLSISHDHATVISLKMSILFSSSTFKTLQCLCMNSRIKQESPTIWSCPVHCPLCYCIGLLPLIHLSSTNIILFPCSLFWNNAINLHYAINSQLFTKTQFLNILRQESLLGHISLTHFAPPLYNSAALHYFSFCLKVGIISHACFEHSSQLCSQHSVATLNVYWANK